ELHHLDGVFVAAVGLDLKPEQAEAEDREVETGEQRRLDDAGDDTEPGAVDAYPRHALPLAFCAAAPSPLAISQAVIRQPGQCRWSPCCSQTPRGRRAA